MDHGFLYGELNRLQLIKDKRGTNWWYLSKYFEGCCEIWDYPEHGGVHWRFNIFIDEGRDDLMRHLHAKGYHASSWHAPADLFFGQRRGADRWPVTDWVADHILNLWVDHTVGDEYIEGVSREVREWTTR
jgi:dTDP-4-amino-4,6-dideoxygalactose transaminase